MGFKFELGGSGPASGGPSAFGRFVLDDRRLELQYRPSLELATYHLGNPRSITSPYERGARAGRWESLSGFSQKLLAPFEGLPFDLEHFASAVLLGNGEEFTEISKAARKSPKGFCSTSLTSLSSVLQKREMPTLQYFA